MEEKKSNSEHIEELVLRAQKGDTDSFAKLYDTYVDQIYRYVYFRVKHDDALDLTENIFLKVWENIRSYQTGKKYFTSWIYKISHNTVVDYYRLSKNTDPLDLSIPDEKKDIDPIVLTERRINNDNLFKAINKLKKRYQQILILKYINELENSEIAKIMNKSEGSLRILKFRALRALRQVLDEMKIKF
jgi:RNA polymerase sigma-70 factor, ECF subfamily